MRRSTAGRAGVAWSAKAEWTHGEANPRFIVTSLSKAENERPLSLRESLLRPRRHGEPDQGMPGRSVRRPDLDGHHARQPTQALVRLVRLCSRLRRSGASASRTRNSRTPLAARSGSSSSSSPASSASARAGSNSPSPRPVPTPTNGVWPPPASPEASPRRRQIAASTPRPKGDPKQSDSIRANRATAMFVHHTGKR